MPPKKTGIQKLQEQLKKQKQEKQKPKTVKSTGTKKKPARPKTHHDIERATQEDEAVREFFTELVKLPNLRVVSAIQKFSSDPKGSWGRQRFFDKMLGVLPEEYYKDFAQEYLEQHTKNLNDFWQYYIDFPEINQAIKDKTREEDEEFEERERIKQVQKDLFGESVDEEDEEFTYYEKEEKTPRKIKIIGDDGEVIEIPSPQKTKQKYHADVNTNCLHTYRTIPWIDARVEAVYINPEHGSDITSYTIAGKEIEENGEIWYRAGNSFTKMMCNIYARNRVQDGEVLTVFTNSGLPIRVRVGYKTNKGFIVQDEKIFQKEKEYYKEQRLSHEEKIKRIFEQPMTEKYKKFGIESLSQVLHSVAPGINDYGIYTGDTNKYDTSYIVTAINTIYNKSNTVRDFFTKLANTVVYLTVNNMSDIFKERVKGEYYLPEILVDLTPEEKLPEYYDDPRVTKDIKEKVQKQIDSQIKVYLNNIGRILFRVDYPGERETREPMDLFKSVDLPPVEKWKSACKNKDDVIDLPNYQIIYYKEGDDIWCLNIENIAQQIVNVDKPVNPYTGKPLTKLFLDKFSKLYDLDLKTRGYGGSGGTPIPQPSRPPKPPTPIFCPELLDMIERNILECENELDNDELTWEGKCESLEKGLDESSDEEEDDEDEEEEDEDEEDEEIIESFDTPSSDSPKLSQNNNCHYCDKKTNGEIKTIIDSSEGFKPVEFCCIKCFEDQDKWPRERSKKKSKKGKKGKKSKKDKKSKHGKKGGRNSTKERNMKN